MKSPQLPSPKLAEILNLKNELWLKYENKHHYGSHKGRAIPLMIEEHNKTGINSFAISSSGNAALAAIRAVQSHNKNKPQNQLSLYVFVGNHINEDKLLNLKKEIGTSEKIILEQVVNPKQHAFQEEKQSATKLLRSSTDPFATLGYESLASELSKIENLSAVFIPTSSGTTAEGLYKAFTELKLNPEIHIIQTDVCHPIVSHILSKQNKPEIPNKKGESLAGAIVDLVGHRKEAVAEAVLKSRGNGWIASNAEITEAMAVGKEAGIELSPNSALSIVGLKKALAEGASWNGPVVCLITGA